MTLKDTGLFRALALGIVASASIGASRPLKVGEMAPNCSVTLIDGKKVSLADLRGDVVVLNFWATWCVPCRTELPMLDRYYVLQQKHGLKVFAVTTEGSLPLYQMKKLFAVLHIVPARAISGPYADVSAVPTYYIIDRSGRLRYAKASALNLDDLNTNLVPLLQEPAPPS